MVFYLLFESAAGYALFLKEEEEKIGTNVGEVQKARADYSKFKKMVKLHAFVAFQSQPESLDNINDVSEGVCPQKLQDFIEMNAEKGSTIGVMEEKLGGAIQSKVSKVKITAGKQIFEMIRWVRHHFSKYLKEFDQEEVNTEGITSSQRGLGHAYSRAKVKFNVNKNDTMIIQAIALIDQLDKDINTFAMRVREWYSWHFPELVRIVPDIINYARVAKTIKGRPQFLENVDELRSSLEELTNEETTDKIVAAMRSSMGTDVSPVDMINISRFCDKVVSLADYRTSLQLYLKNRIHKIAPNTATLMGDLIGARLISHAGSLTSLAKLPASTLQILGAEKALFRALKTRGNTPKYGLIFNSPFIQKARKKDRGRIARVLANKASMACRIDAFSDVPTNEYGTKFHEQVEERLEFYKSGTTPQKNLDAMREVNAAVSKSAGAAGAAGDAMEVDESPKKKKSKKRKSEDADDEEEQPKKRRKSSSKKDKDKSDKKKRRKSKSKKDKK